MGDYINATNIIICIIGVAIALVLHLLMYTSDTTIIFDKNVQLYKNESAFYPQHAIIVFIAVAIFISIIYTIHKIDEGLHKKKRLTFTKADAIPIVNLDAGSIIAIGALIVSLIGVFVTSFIETPILDYDIVFNKEDNQYIVKVNNYGNSPAKHVLITFEHNGTIFKDFKSNPFLSNHFKSISTNLSQVEGFVEIDVVPSFSRTDVIAEVNPLSSSTDDPMKVQIRSDETVGKQNTSFLIVYYIPILLFFLIIPILFWRGSIERENSIMVRVILIFIVGILVASVWVSFYFKL